MSGPQDTLRIHTADNVGIGYATAGVGSRLLAQLLDSMVAGLLVFVAVTAYIATVGGRGGEGRLSSLSLMVAGAVGVALFAYLGYFVVAEMSTRGSTLGKSALGLRVMRVDGGAPGMTELLIRNVLRLIDVGVGGVGLLVMFFHPSSRRL
ncbi:MAG: RDD family protein, partial [Candidatus Dormibacteria bacterium]